MGPSEAGRFSKTSLDRGRGGQLAVRRMLHLRVVSGTGGGPEKTILNSPRYIKKEGYEASVVYLCPPQPGIKETLKARADQLDCPLTVIEDHGLRDFSIIGKLLKICREKKIGLLQTHDYKSNAVGLILRRFYRLHLVSMLHGWTDMTGRMPLYKKIDQWCLPWYEKLICVSEDLVADCRQLRIPEHKIHLVHNAIEVDQFARRIEIKEAKRQMGAPVDSLLIGMVCRLSPEKGILEAIAMLDRLRASGQAIQLWIAGDGGYREAIEKEIGKRGLEHAVKLLGQLPDTRIFYQAMDLFLLNSTREGLPNVVLEAMALEVPVVATNIAGVPSLIRHGQTGFLIEPGDDKSLDLNIETCLYGRATRELIQNARRLIGECFSFEHRIRKVADIYDSLRWTNE